MSKRVVKTNDSIIGGQWNLLAALVLLTLAALPYLQVAEFSFLNYDDPLHISTQPAVLSGLNAQSLSWSMTATPSNLWHPLTWLSYMAEVSWFGGGANSPAVHHLGNLALHLGSTLFFFVLLRTLRITTVIAALVALLFSLHPLHVEPVAWISSRKDVLYAFFAMVSLCCYVRSRGQAWGRWFWLALITFAAALASKPSAIVLPALYVLLDYVSPQEQASEKNLTSQLLGQLASKWVYCALAGLAAGVTVLTQYSGSHSEFIGQHDLLSRITYLPASLGFYLQHSLYPRNLTFEYAYPEGIRFAVLSIVGGLFLSGLVYAFARCRRRCSALIIGGLWYLACLSPVLGFFYVGSGFTADRYVYLALAGPAIALAVYLQSLRGLQRKMSLLIVCLSAFFFAVLSFQQVHIWKGDTSLFTHGVMTEPRSGTAQANLATLYRMHGKDELALTHYQKAMHLEASHYIVCYNMAQIYAKRGESSQAIKECRHALRFNPNYARVHHYLAQLLTQSYGASDETFQHFQQASELEPSSVKFSLSYADAHVIRRDYDEADRVLRQSLKAGRHSPQDQQKVKKMLRRLAPYLERGR